MLVCRDCAQSLGWAVKYCPFCGQAQPVAVAKIQPPTPAPEAVPVHGVKIVRARMGNGSQASAPAIAPNAIPDIHGWPTGKVQALQQAAAEALGLPVVFGDPEFRSRCVQTVQAGQRLIRKHWLGAHEYEPIYEDRESIVTVAPPAIVIIPAGRFLMGSPDGEADREVREGPQHQVIIPRPFAIGRYAVTRGQFAAFVAASGYRTEAERGGGIHIWNGSQFALKPTGSWRRPGFAQTAAHPVVGVSWNDAHAYCEWLCGQTGQPYRLPTEAEWEYACRAGTATHFHCGESLSTDQANYNGNYPYGAGAKGQYREQTALVGSLPANPWGLCEMHGNVCEWCQDWHGVYAAGPITDPRGPVTGERRVLRGGSWSYFGRLLRSAYRDNRNPGFRDGNIGFRLVLGSASLRGWR